MADAGYPNPISEVAAAGSGISPEAVVSAWMNHASHRAILTNESTRHIGIAYAARASGCSSAFWVGDTGGAPDSEFLDATYCDEPGGTPQCVPEPGAAARPSAALATLAALARRSRRRRSELRGARKRPAASRAAFSGPPAVR